MEPIQPVAVPQVTEDHAGAQTRQEKMLSEELDRMDKFQFQPDPEVATKTPEDLAAELAQGEIARREMIAVLVDRLGAIQIQADQEKVLVKKQLRALGWRNTHKPRISLGSPVANVGGKGAEGK